MPLRATASEIWRRWKSIVVLGGSAALIGASAMLSQYIWKENGLRSVQAINEQRVQLVANAVKAEINRQDHLPVVLSLDSDVRKMLAAPTQAERDQLSRKVTVLSREADTRALCILGSDGIVLASDNWNTPDSLVGRNFSDRPYS